MATEGFMADARASADRDDARTNARLTEILHQAGSKKARRQDAAPSTPGWLQSKASKPASRQKPQPPQQPKRTVRKQGPKARPPKGSDASWKLAIETVSKQQAEE